MLWTVFKVFIVAWMLQLVFRFGGNAIQIVLVVSLVSLLLRIGVPRTSFNAGGLPYFHQDRKAQLETSLGHSPAPRR